MLRSACRNWSSLTQPRTRLVCSMSSVAGKVEPFTEVWILDPRTLIQVANTATSSCGVTEEALNSISHTSLAIPSHMLPSLAEGKLELDEMDEPLNSFLFADRDELFKYKMVGEHSTQSGWTSIVSRELLKGLTTPGGSAKSNLPSWQRFAELASAAQGPFLQVPPFLFVGRILEAPAAAVYVLEEKGSIRGLMLSSSAARED